MTRINEDAIKQLFTEARTATAWQSKPVEDALLHDIYELMKWGPTSANTNPARLLFVKSAPEKEKLISTLMPGNVEKVKAAPVIVIIATDEKFYDLLPRLFPPAPQYRDMFAGNKAFADTSAMRNGSLQGAYFMFAARAVGLDCGPMSGFDNAKVDELFFKGTTWKSNFICSIGYGDRDKLRPRLPRLSFDEFCKIV